MFHNLSLFSTKSKFQIVWIKRVLYCRLGANKVGVDSMGILFGYGHRTELETAGATYNVETVADIEQIILRTELVGMDWEYACLDTVPFI